jgi:exonuclease VII small subunit
MAHRFPDPPPISQALQRAATAERLVEHLRALLGELDRSTAAYDLALAWLKECERAAFNRRLELEALLKERRSLTLVPRDIAS